MGKTKLNFAILFESLKSTIHDWKILCKGQSVDSQILQLAHRLEKGMAIKNPRPLWGWEKARLLQDLILKSNSSEAIIGKAVLNAFLSQKKNSSNEKDRELACTFSDAQENKKYGLDDGGIVVVEKTVFKDEVLEHLKSLFNSRHSIRTFNTTSVDPNLLNSAIELALRCPSACNRQPFHIYVVEAQKKYENISSNSNIKANQYLYITGDISAYRVDEYNDWLISPAIFVGYLSLALHTYGIGACIIRKDLIQDKGYNDKVKKFCGIPQNEKLVLEMAIGNYDDSIVVPISKRKTIDDIVTFL